jgi:hypothetical protein
LNLSARTTSIAKASGSVRVIESNCCVAYIKILRKALNGSNESYNNE